MFFFRSRKDGITLEPHFALQSANDCIPKTAFYQVGDAVMLNFKISREMAECFEVIKDSYVTIDILSDHDRTDEFYMVSLSFVVVGREHILDIDGIDGVAAKGIMYCITLEACSDWAEEVLLRLNLGSEKLRK